MGSGDEKTDVHVEGREWLIGKEKILGPTKKKQEKPWPKGGCLSSKNMNDTV